MIVYNKRLKIKGKIIWRDPFYDDIVVIEEKNGVTHEVILSDCEEVKPLWITIGKKLLRCLGFRTTK